MTGPFVGASPHTSATPSPDVDTSATQTQNVPAHSHATGRPTGGILPTEASFL